PKGQRGQPAEALRDPKAEAQGFPGFFNHPADGCLRAAVAMPPRKPAKILKGTSAAAKTPNSTARKVTTDIHPGQPSDRTRSRHAAAPPNTRMPAITPKLAVRTAPNRNRFDRRRRATACRSSSNPQGSTPIRSLPELRIRARIHE